MFMVALLCWCCCVVVGLCGICDGFGVVWESMEMQFPDVE